MKKERREDERGERRGKRRQRGEREETKRERGRRTEREGERCKCFLGPNVLRTVTPDHVWNGFECYGSDALG